MLFTLEIAAEYSATYDQYVLQANGRPRTTDDLVWVATQIAGKKINLYQLDLDVSARNVEAVCFANQDGSFDIGILSGLTAEEERFVVCKEIFHALLDREECRNINLFEHVASTLDAQDDLAVPTRAAAAEELAVIGALEFIFPYSAREAIMAAADGRIDAEQLAEQYSIPRRLIDTVFNDDSIAFFRQVMPMLERTGV
ncbi:ImmA/IrrE family metallo-endopeptidase [Cognatilysobacter lacus]|uniref:ImmA/IrrE family metallo-endopeptidase n=1 Tax=Cognatilysobacter lacus TaxID=1643323 RepID=UPI001658C631|nr:ImmA/IrrE family metallo-endopeptidase [Lysobacter lacus]